MKILIVYYSRTGLTKKACLYLADKIKADHEEIIDPVDRRGAVGYLLSGRDALYKKIVQINKIKSNLSHYDLIVIATPIWASRMSVAVRSFLIQHGSELSRIAFLATQGSSGAERAFKEMAIVINKEPIAKIVLTSRQVANNNFSDLDLWGEQLLLLE